jgi:hypothetical protein
MQGARESGLKFLVAALAAGLLVAVIAAAASSGDSSAGHSGVVVPQPPNAVQRTYALLEGIPQHGPYLGEPKAPVTLQFFGDLQCKDSRAAMLGALPFLIRRWVRPGKLQIRFRSLPAETLNWYEFRDQQTAALAAGRQGKLWNYIDVFFREQQTEFTHYANAAFLNRIAVQAGVGLGRWSEDLTPFRESWVGRIKLDEALAAAHRLGAAPSFLIGRTGGASRAIRHFSLEEPQVFEEAIENLL